MDISEVSVSPETVLAQIWKDVLQVGQVGPEDDFFSLGGDSLLALKVIGVAQQRGMRLTVLDLFRNPTPRGACAALRAEDDTAGQGARELLSPLDLARVPDDAEDVYPAARLQLGLIYESLVGQGAVYLDVVSRSVRRPLDEGALRRALDLLSARHPVLRTRFDLSTYSEPMQEVARQAPIPLATADYAGLDAGTRTARYERVMADLARPFDPERAPLVRVHAAATEAGAFLVSYSFHHAILDGWSEAVFFNELVRTYAGLIAGQPPELAPAVPYREFVRLERAALQDEGAGRELVTGLAPVHRRSPEPPRHRKVSAALSASEGARLTELAGRWGVPLKSLLLAAASAAVGRVWDTGDPVLGLLLNGRPELAGADLTLGLFLNQLPVRPGVPAGDWHAAARRALAAENAVLAHRRFPHSEVRRLLGGDPFEVMFNYVHFHPRDELLEAGLIAPWEDMRDHTSLPVRVEALNDAKGDGLSVHVTADVARYGEGAPDHLLRAVVDAIHDIVSGGR